MKILMLGWELPPHNSGGLGVACYGMCQALSRYTDIDIEFVLPYAAEHKSDFMTVTPALPEGVSNVEKLAGAYDSYQYTYRDGRQEWRDVFGQQQLYETAVARLVESREYDVIHAHDWLTFRAGLRAKDRSGRPLILHVHSIERDRAGGGDGNPMVREIEATAFQMADRIIAVSGHTKYMIVRDYGIPADKIDVVHNSIDITDMEALDEDNAYSHLAALKKDGWRVVSNVGRLTVQKNLRNLLIAARDAIERQPKTIFLLVGGGEQYHELLGLAAELGIGRNVIITGFQRGKRWRDSFAIADLFVMPSTSEPFGLTVLEAIQYGAPALISKQSGVGEVIRHCLKVDSWDVRGLADQITAAVRSSSLTEELRHNASRELQKLSWNDAAEQMKRIYSHHLEPVT